MIILFFLLFLCTSKHSTQAFLTGKSPQSQVSSLAAFKSLAKISSGDTQSIEIKSYEYDGWNLTYRYKPAARGFEKEPPLLLIHPVGIGLSSWFWTRFMEKWNGSAIFAPNLIGCGVSEGGDPWNPDERGISFPLGWVKGCEALMMTEKSADSFDFPFWKNSNQQQWTVVAQGGLAPVGVMLASRNEQSVQKLILTSPPTWKDMTTPVPESELARNYNFLKSPILGNVAFKVLESRGAIEFFSNQFLFSEPCDSEWLDNAEKELCVASRPPVMAFNAGFCLHRSYIEEMTTLEQPTIIFAGKDDKRQRQEYVDEMKKCRLIQLPGTNVLPWESPDELAKAINLLS